MTGSAIGAPIQAGYFGSAASIASSVTLERVTVTGNHSYEGTGTDYDPRSVGGSATIVATNITVSSSTFSDNTADIATGPALFGTNVTVTDSEIINNLARIRYGGLVVIADYATITGSVINDNRAPRFAGLLNYESYSWYPGSGSTLEISDTSISYNQSLYGPVNVMFSQYTLLDRVSVIGNSSNSTGPEDNGLPATLFLQSNARILSSTIADNTGIGVVVGDRRFGVTRVGTSNLLQPLTDNLRPSLSPMAVGSITVEHSTIANNTLDGIAADPNVSSPLTAESISLDHVIVAGNGGATGSDISTPFTSRFSIVQNATGKMTEGAEAGNQVGIDPQLQPLHWFSALSATFPILRDSPGWNAGDPAFVPPPDLDQRLAPRVVEIVDIGAFEVQNEPEPEPPVVPVVPVIPAFTG